jgi:predicted nucleotidyltransferase
MVLKEHVISQLQHNFLSTGVERVILFGPFARNTQTGKSDVDLIVIKQTDKRFFDRYDDFNDIESYVCVPVDCLIYTPAEWEIIYNRIFFKNVLKKATEIHVHL